MGKPDANYCTINAPPDSQHERNVINNMLLIFTAGLWLRVPVKIKKVVRVKNPSARIQIISN